MAMCWTPRDRQWWVLDEPHTPSPPRMRGLTTPVVLAMYTLDELLVKTDSHKLVL